MAGGQPPSCLELAQGPPLVAALLNGASSHVEEMDDLHDRSIYHPGTCVFPAALAVAEAEAVGPREFLTASVAGYEVSLRIGRALGPQHYRYSRPTGAAGTFGAAVAAGTSSDSASSRTCCCSLRERRDAGGGTVAVPRRRRDENSSTAEAAFDGALYLSCRSGLHGYH